MRRIVKNSIVISVILTSNIVAEFKFDKVPTQLTACYMSKIQPIQKVKSKLIANGFKIVSTDRIFKDKIVITITNDELKATNSYMATLHILINNKDNEIRVQNPSYLADAYIKDYRYGDFKRTLLSLKKVLNIMVPILQKKDFTELPYYHFMFGMPYIDDTIVVAEHVTYPKKENISYTLKLPNGSILIGHKLSQHTNNFLNTIYQSKNAQLLPYESIIKDGEATILDPKYYLPLSLPNLSMNHFMKIATTPDSIEKEIKISYK